ncbi:MAG: traC [Actinomycetia bacterium]|nr:traC [Actinomycetes bacterium]
MPRPPALVGIPMLDGGSLPDPRCRGWSGGPRSRTFCPARTARSALACSSTWCRRRAGSRTFAAASTRAIGIGFGGGCTAAPGSGCEVCGAVPDRERDVRLEAHERWDFLETERVQKLMRLICLCNRCHEVTHFGFAQIQGTDQRALAHLMQVTGLSCRDAQDHVQRAFRVWESRSRHNWTLDLAILTDAGVRIVEPPSATERRGVGRSVLDSDGPRPAKPIGTQAARSAGPGSDRQYRDPQSAGSRSRVSHSAARRTRRQARHVPPSRRPSRLMLRSGPFW